MAADLAAFLQIHPWPPDPGPLFWLALALVAGALLGEAAQRLLSVPRIVGYGAVGLALAASGLGLQGGVLPPPVRLVVDLALGVLLFVVWWTMFSGRRHGERPPDDDGR